ncbi:MAG TPA: hypothetical protein VNV43_01410 [Candidatus Acidoferrales bacterium]|nr:hypothetical protein [Candidatus Acidoferrales bacterium]
MNWRHALRFMTKGFSIGLRLIIFMGACSRGEETKPPTNLVSAPTNFTLVLPGAQSASTAPAMIKRSYAVGKVGVLDLGFPREWNDTIRKVDEGGKQFDAVQFGPAEGNDFAIMVEVIYVGETNTDKLDTKAALFQAGQGELARSVEKSLDIQDFQGEQDGGSYFVVTDKNFSMLAPPGPDDYRYLMQGYAKLNGVVLTVRLVSNHIANQQPAVLEMIKTAHFARNVPGESPVPPAPR